MIYNPERVTITCETCAGAGTVDECLGGHPFSNPAAPCPDCAGKGEFVVSEITYWYCMCTWCMADPEYGALRHRYL